jgi:reactive intermediate/imine deaminase
MNHFFYPLILTIGILTNLYGQTTMPLLLPNATANQTYSDGYLHENLLFISGQLGTDPITDVLRNESFEIEAKQAIENIGKVLKLAELNYTNLVSMTVYLKNKDNYKKLDNIYRKYFKNIFPTRTTIIVSDLVLGANIEITAIATKSTSKIQNIKTINYYHVDVFSQKKFSGNGLTIFPNSEALDKNQMLKITNEMRQFESIFLQKKNDSTFRAFIFTMEEELDFAGHPVIGAAAFLHDRYAPTKEKATWTLELNKKTVTLTTEKKTNYYTSQMNQGNAQFGLTLTTKQEEEFLKYFGLTNIDKYEVS